MSYFLRLCLMVFCFNFVGCTNNNGGAKAPSNKKSAMQQRVYVSSAEPEQSGTLGRELQVKVSGNLPSPAYSFDKFNIQVKDKIIHITPLANFDSNKIAAQMLVPFERVCKLANLKPGEYQIQIHGRGDAVVEGGTVQIK